MSTSLEKWRSITQDPRVVGFFGGTFERAGVRVTDTGEAFTCIHRGDRIDFEPALDESRVDYTVVLTSPQVDHFATEASTGDVTTLEQFRIVSTLFSPATAATLKNPILSHGMLRRLARVEDLIHVHLVSPAPNEEPDATHTLVHASGQWLVVPGIHGRARRVFRLSMDEAIAYQRRVLQAMKSPSPAAWIGFASWYLAWRRRTSRRS